MVSARVRSWVIPSIYERPHKDTSPRGLDACTCVCLCVCVERDMHIVHLLAEYTLTANKCWQMAAKLRE